METERPSEKVMRLLSEQRRRTVTVDKFGGNGKFVREMTVESYRSSENLVIVQVSNADGTGHLLNLAMKASDLRKLAEVGLR